MDKFKIRPYDDYEAWDTAETIEEARSKRSKPDMYLFSRVVVIVEVNGSMCRSCCNDIDYDDDDDIYDNIDYEDIYDNIDDYEYPYNYINHNDLV